MLSASSADFWSVVPDGSTGSHSACPGMEPRRRRIEAFRPTGRGDEKGAPVYYDGLRLCKAGAGPGSGLAKEP